MGDQFQMPEIPREPDQLQDQDPQEPTELQPLLDSGELPESPFVVFTDLYSTNTDIHIHVTMRGIDPQKTFARFVEFLAWVKKQYGLVPYHTRYNDQPPPPQPARPEAAPQSPPAAPQGYSAAPQPPQAVAPIMPPNSQDNQLNVNDAYPAEVITPDFSGESLFFRVKSRLRYPRYPVIVWPEVLERAGFDVKGITGPVALQRGWVAYFARNDRGNPSKVIALDYNPSVESELMKKGSASSR